MMKTHGKRSSDQKTDDDNSPKDISWYLRDDSINEFDCNLAGEFQMLSEGKTIAIYDFVDNKWKFLGENSGDRSQPPRKGTIAERMRLLADIHGDTVRDHVRKFFPELVELERAEEENRDSQAVRIGKEEQPSGAPDTPALPEKVSALWAEAKEPDDTPPAFIQRHYAPWLGNGLTRADVRRLDPQLYMALANWLRKNDLPEGFELPTA